MTVEFDKDFEEDILARALKDVAYLKKAVRILEAHHFHSPQHGWIWQVVFDTWTKYREITSPRSLLERAKTDHPKDDDRLPYIQLTSRLFKHKPQHSEAALGQLTEFVKTINAQIAMERAAIALEKGKVEETYATLQKLLRKQVTAKDYTVVNWIEELDERQAARKLRKEHPELFTCIPTGWPRLDSIIDGLELGELGLIMATTGKGKSIAMNNIAHCAAARGFETVIFPLEMPARQVAARQDARWLNMSYQKLKHYDLKPSELRAIQARWKKMKKRFANKLKIVSMPLRRCNIDIVRGALDDLEQEHDFKPKLVIVDSGDHMKSVDRTESHRLDTAEVYWSLKSLAEEGGYAVWSSTQAGREWAKQIATAEASSESYDKSRIADVVLSINTPDKDSRSTKVAIDEDGEEVNDKSAEMSAEGWAEMFIAKYRDGKSGVTIPLHCDFDKMLIEELP